MISIIGAQSHFFDMRVGDFGCITRLVFEFTGKVDYTSSENDNRLAIKINSLKESRIILPVESSNNIQEIQLVESKNTADINIDFIYPIEVSSYAYYKENKNYIIVFDIYDKAYHVDKEKGLTSLLFKGQKFSLESYDSTINEFSAKYPNDPLVNFYLGRLYARNTTMKDKAISFFSQVDSTSEFYFTAQAYIDNLQKNKFPSGEIKPDFLIPADSLNSTNAESKLMADSMNTPMKDNDLGQDDNSSNKETRNKQSIKENTLDNIQNKENTREEAGLTNEEDIQTNIILLTAFIVSLIFSLFLLFKNLRKNIQLKELQAKLENSEYELKALANKLEKGIIENSKTKDRMIIKLFNSGWKAEDIAKELNTPLDIINATINKEGHL